MSHNILITGAAGFIGGSVLADFIARTDGAIKAARISAVVRTEEQVQALSKLGVNVLQIDLKDETAIIEAVIANQIDLIVHTASSIDSQLASHLIKALGKVRKDSGKDVYFFHSSVDTVYSVEGGWPKGEVKDTDPIFEKEKELGGPHPVRLADVLVVEQAKAQGVTSFIISVPVVYGRGTGERRKLSVNIPTNIRTSIRHKVVHRFDENGSPTAVHISDLVALYTLLVEKILHKERIPSGEEGFYFSSPHIFPWWDVLERIARSLYTRGLIETPEVQTWSSDKKAAECLGFPAAYVHAMGTSKGQLVSVKAYQLGWKPKWDKERFLESIDDEVQAVLDLDMGNSNLFDVLMPPSK